MSKSVSQSYDAIMMKREGLSISSGCMSVNITDLLIKCIFITLHLFPQNREKRHLFLVNYIEFESNCHLNSMVTLKEQYYVIYHCIYHCLI